MNYRLQLSHVSSVSEANGSPYQAQRLATARWEDAKFYRSWLVYTSGKRVVRVHKQINWDAVLGIGMATLVSACIWAGIGLLIARIW